MTIRPATTQRRRPADPAGIAPLRCGSVRSLLLAFAVCWSACTEPPAPSDAAISPSAPSAAEQRTPQPAPTPTAAEPVRSVAKTLLAGPRLRFDDTLWDWGTAPAGNELRHIFVLHNDGDTTVHIRKARPT